MFLYLVIFVLTFLYVTITRHYNQWQRHGIAAAESVIPFGSLGALFRKEKTMGLAITDIYERFSDNIVGIMLAFKPAILVRDAELARQMLTKDFDSFHDRGVYVDEKKDPLSANLFSLKGQSWHNMRTKLSPSFSSGKLKAMFETVDEVGNKMIEHVLQQFEGGREKVSLDIKDITTT